MSDSNKTPIHDLVKERQIPSSTEDTKKLASEITERPEKQVVINMASTGKWKYAAITNM